MIQRIKKQPDGSWKPIIEIIIKDGKIVPVAVKQSN